MEYRLNFARSWRPQFFREVVGQRTPVQLLANGLARGIYFPVYLFSGMRGSGKTSVGRLFAAALNCQRLEAFRNGQCSWEDLPCGECPSCLLMKRSEHPDFIEVDAASYTGVENIRQIIDEAQFLPVIGGKKVYLVDEAHMLSKSAFNAFLKMLEEPPASVVFLLATTEAHKILDTVRSRSFQLFFDPLPVDILAKHLLSVAAREGFICTSEAALVLAQQSEGSVRDALTALEQAAMSGATEITVDLVQGLFGLVSYSFVFELFKALATGDVASVFEQVAFFAQQRRSFAHGWSVLVEVATGAMWYSKGVCVAAMEPYRDNLKQLLAVAPVGFFDRVLDIFFKYEPLLQKTQHTAHVFERMIISIIDLVGNRNPVEFSCTNHGNEPVKAVRAVESSKPASNVVAPVAQELGVVAHPIEPDKSRDDSQPWSQFLSRVQPRCSDPILFSVLSAGSFESVENGSVYVVFPKSFAFYQELLVQSRSVWQASLEESFGQGVVLVPSFSHGGGSKLVRVPETKASREEQAGNFDNGSQKNIERSSASGLHKKKVATQSAQVVDVSDATVWPVAHELVTLFPGNVRLYEE